MKKWKCDVCGYVMEGETPCEVCPVCGAGENVFAETDGRVDEGMKQWLCLFCGFIYETAEKPELCPECQVKGTNMFVEYDKNQEQFKDAGTMFRCKACGLVQVQDEVPSECPACGASSTAFISRDEWLENRK